MSEYRSLKIETQVESVIIHNIIEYAIGFYFVFVKTENETLAFDRDDIKKIFRLRNGEWSFFQLKKVPDYKN